MVLFMIQVKEVAMIGPASFRSRREMLSRPVGERGRERERERERVGNRKVATRFADKLVQQI